MFRQSKPKPLLIVPLGIHFVPDDKLAINELFKYVGKQPEKMGAFFKNAGPFIEKLKQGMLSVEEFDKSMIDIIKEVFSTTLTTSQFNEVWSARYTNKMPKDLKALTDESKNSEIVIYSYTNVKDEQIIINLCRSKEIEIKLDEQKHLQSIQGIEVRTSHTENTDKAGLFKQIITEKYQHQRDISIILGSAKPQQIPELKQKLEESNHSVKESVETIKISVQLVEHDPRDELNFSTLLQPKPEQCAQILHKL